ncbi:hypothetical protein R6Q59_016868 [Mikania micrantha]
MCYVERPEQSAMQVLWYFFKHDANSTLKNLIEMKYCKALKNQTSLGQTSMTNEGNVLIQLVMFGRLYTVYLTLTFVLRLIGYKQILDN